MGKEKIWFPQIISYNSKMSTFNKKKKIRHYSKNRKVYTIQRNKIYWLETVSKEGPILELQFCQTTVLDMLKSLETNEDTAYQS